ncbi:sugar phosphate isomerase/epimerase [Leptolyngbya sp. 15MV]|nr:sugar phosphate isomerase/epimerase [Leptolyngbya sp. 15MV]
MGGVADKIEIRPCADEQGLRRYIDDHWRRGHVLAHSDAMFAFTYRTPWVDRRAFPSGVSVLTLTDGGRLLGFLGAICAPYPRETSYWLALWHVIETAFDELARRWRPILDVFEENGVDACYEIHPGEDLFDGTTFEMFLDRVGNHPRCNILYDPSHFVLQQLDYLAFIDIYHARIRAFHAKDAEFNPSGRQGVYSGYAPWAQRAGRFRSLGDGQVDFGGVFSKLSQYGFAGWAVLEWECCIKDSEQGAAEGAPFIASHIINVASRAFDDFAASGVDEAANRALLGLSR